MSASDFDINDLVCPLPVLRHGYVDDDGERGQLAVHHCGEPLHVHYTFSRYLLASGEMDGCGPSWEVVCEGGHTLLLPDFEGDDPSGIPLDPALAQEALSGIGVVVMGGSEMAFQPLEVDAG